MALPVLPLATIVIEPYYNSVLIWNFAFSILCIIMFNFEKPLNRFFDRIDIKVDAIGLIEIMVRMCALVNISFFLFQFFTADLFVFQKQYINYQG